MNVGGKCVICGYILKLSDWASFIVSFNYAIVKDFEPQEWPLPDNIRVRGGTRK
jgi:hypothetical protein